MKPRPSSSTASFMLIATESVTSWAWAGLTEARRRRATRTTRIATNMDSSSRGEALTVSGHRTHAARRRSKCTDRHNDRVTGASYGYGTMHANAVPDDLRRRPDSRPGLRRGRRRAGDRGPAAVSARPGGAPQRDGLDSTG